MTTKKRQNIEWGLVAIGLFFIVCFFWSDKDDIDKNSLVTKTIILNKDIKKVIGNRSRQAYYICLRLVFSPTYSKQVGEILNISNS